MGSKSRAISPGRTSARYWRTAEAVQAHGGAATLAEVQVWDREHFPDDPLGNVQADLEHLTVNAPSRVHYDKSRKNWRSDEGHPRDLLFKIVDAGPPRRVRYELFSPAIHGHVDLRKNHAGKWEVVSLPMDAQARAEAEGYAEAFGERRPLSNDHDSRVRVMRAIAERRGQPVFRARLLEVYGGRCAITGTSAAEVLEAAHVLPYRGEHTNRIDNGLLLRADLHTLFDCLLLWVTPEHKVGLAPSLLTTDYASLAGKPIRLPAAIADRPHPAHLAEHASRCEARLHGLARTDSGVSSHSPLTS